MAIKNQNLRIIFVLILLIPVMLGFLDKTYNKATKKEELILISTEREKNIGRSVAAQVEKQFETTDDPLVGERVEKIGKRIAEVCERKDLAYYFKALKAKKDDDYNAFSLPGGYVYIFDVFVKKMNNDDEIAAVLSHEVGHIEAKHSIKRLQASMGMNALMVLGIGMGADGNNIGEAGYALSQLMMSYSREDELEADNISIRYLKKSGFDPEGVIKCLELLRDIRKKGPIVPYMYFRTHPYISERLANARIEVNETMDFDSYINLPRQKEDF